MRTRPPPRTPPPPSPKNHSRLSAAFAISSCVEEKAGKRRPPGAASGAEASSPRSVSGYLQASSPPSPGFRRIFGRRQTREALPVVRSPARGTGVGSRSGESAAAKRCWPALPPQRKPSEEAGRPKLAAKQPTAEPRGGAGTQECAPVCRRAGSAAWLAFVFLDRGFAATPGEADDAWAACSFPAGTLPGAGSPVVCPPRAFWCRLRPVASVSPIYEEQSVRPFLSLRALLGRSAGREGTVGLTAGAGPGASLRVINPIPARWARGSAL